MATLTPDQARTQATTQLAPDYNSALNTLDLQGKSLDQSGLDINQNYDRLAQTLQDAAVKSTKALEERQNQLGLLQSGLTAAGEGDIQKTLNTNLGTNEQQRASRLAQIALQRAGLAQKRTNLTNKYNADINAAVDQLLNPKLTQLDLGNRVVMVDPQGNIRQSFPKVKVSGSSGSGGSSGGGYGKKFKFTPAVMKNAISIIRAVPSDNPNADKNDPYISTNEASQALQRIKSTYGLDDQTALDVLNQAFSAGGFVRWESLSPDQQQKILSGG